MGQFLPWEHKVALTGLSHSGKSIFLSSLLQHLEYFEKSAFPLAFGKNDLMVSAFEEKPVVDPYFHPFPRSVLIGNLTSRSGGVLPDSTRDACKYHCTFDVLNMPRLDRFKLKNPLSALSMLKSNYSIDMQFVDFPGERLADVDIFRHEDYAQWSDETLKLYSAHTHIFKSISEYVKLIDNPNPGGKPSEDTSAKFLRIYKAALTSMVENFTQLITPSTFWREFTSGKELSQRDLKERGASRHCGLPGSEFTPLSATARALYPEITKRYAENYTLYRNNVIMPLFSEFTTCDKLIFTVDIPHILNSGIETYNETVAIIQSLGKAMQQAYSFYKAGIDKVMFVATKCDMVSMDPLDQSNMLRLTTDLMNKMNQKMSTAKFESHVVSAWRSTTPVAGNPYLLNSMILAQADASGDDDEAVDVECEPLQKLHDVEYAIPKVPREWNKAGWEPYRFPDQALYPLRMYSAAPDCINLHKVFLSLLD